MSTRFIEDLEKETGLEKRKIYNIIRRQEFYDKFGIEKMADLPEGVNNGSVSKMLTDEMYEYLKEKIAGTCGFRRSDDDVKDVVYLIDLNFGTKVVDQNGKEQRRFKLGYTSKYLHERESNIKVSSPEARVIKYWKMGKSDEQTLLKFADGAGANRIGTSEVYDVYDFDQFVSTIEEFYKKVS